MGGDVGRMTKTLATCVLLDPVQVLVHSGVDSRVVRSGAAATPGDNTCNTQYVSTIVEKLNVAKLSS